MISSAWRIPVSLMAVWTLMAVWMLVAVSIIADLGTVLIIASLLPG
jgi:hypothetical protein